MSEHMDRKFNDRSRRLRGWNYGGNAIYFITINTKGNIHYFGNVVDNKVGLSEIGKVANKCWLEIPLHFPFVKLESYVVMPNHIHGILIIDKKEYGDRNISLKGQGTQNLASLQCQIFQCPNRSLIAGRNLNFASQIDQLKIIGPIVGTQNLASQNPEENSKRIHSILRGSSFSQMGNSRNQFGPQTKNLGSIIRGFKAGVTVKAKKLNPDFGWQPRYYDHIIRNNTDYKRIVRYIHENPSKWRS